MELAVLFKLNEFGCLLDKSNSFDNYTTKIFRCRNQVTGRKVRVSATHHFDLRGRKMCPYSTSKH